MGLKLFAGFLGCFLSSAVFADSSYIIPQECDNVAQIISSREIVDSPLKAQIPSQACRQLLEKIEAARVNSSGLRKDFSPYVGQTLISVMESINENSIKIAAIKLSRNEFSVINKSWKGKFDLRTNSFGADSSAENSGDSDSEEQIIGQTVSVANRTFVVWSSQKFKNGLVFVNEISQATPWWKRIISSLAC